MAVFPPGRIPIDKNPANVGRYGYLDGNNNNSVVVVSGQVTYSF